MGDTETSSMAMTSETQGFPEGAGLGYIPSPLGPGLGIEEDSPEKPRGPNSGPGASTSFALSHKHHEETGEVKIVNPFCK